MENCVFCLRNAVVNQNLLQNRGLSHLQLIQSLYLRLLTAPKPLEIHTGILSDVLQLVQSVLESNPVNIVFPAGPIHLPGHATDENRGGVHQTNGRIGDGVDRRASGRVAELPDQIDLGDPREHYRGERSLRELSSAEQVFGVPLPRLF